MNLHEECLLKYLLNPFDLVQTTELLKLNNELLQKANSSRLSLAKPLKTNISINII